MILSITHSLNMYGLEYLDVMLMSFMIEVKMCLRKVQQSWQIKLTKHICTVLQELFDSDLEIHLASLS